MSHNRKFKNIVDSIHIFNQAASFRNFSEFLQLASYEISHFQHSNSSLPANLRNLDVSDFNVMRIIDLKILKAFDRE